LPKDLPPKSTAHSYFVLWEWDGTLERIHHALYVETREREGREASPTVAIIDSLGETPMSVRCSPPSAPVLRLRLTTALGVKSRSASNTTPFFPNSSRNPSRSPVSRGRDEMSPPHVGVLTV
jgi:hypothetical protein